MISSVCVYIIGMVVKIAVFKLGVSDISQESTEFIR